MTSLKMFDVPAYVLYNISATFTLKRKARKTQGKPMEKRKEAEASLYCTIQTTVNIFVKP